jgi:hypothetical protein
MWFFNFGRRNWSRLLATGQLTSYGSGAGVDDGALQKGIVKRYAILTTGQYSGTTGITINSKTDTHSNNCVFDDNTGLMWSRYASASVGPASDGKLPWTTTGSGTTEEGIFPYCAAANAGTLAGYTDWYVPNKGQLMSLVDYEASTAYPDTVAFPAWAANPWCSTTAPSTVANSYLVYFFSNGALVSTVKTTNSNAVLVRG